MIADSLMTVNTKGCPHVSCNNHLRSCYHLGDISGYHPGYIDTNLPKVWGPGNTLREVLPASEPLLP